MQLSDSLMLGFSLMETLGAYDTRKCAIGASLKCHGIEPLGSQFEMVDYNCLIAIYPWLKTTTAICPRCDRTNKGLSLIYHPFDLHVMNDKKLTLEQFVDYVRTIEPQETPEEKREIVEMFCESLVNQ